jgi:hypothetical protein
MAMGDLGLAAAAGVAKPEDRRALTWRTPWTPRFIQLRPMASFSGCFLAVANSTF